MGCIPREISIKPCVVCGKPLNRKIRSSRDSGQCCGRECGFELQRRIKTARHENVTKERNVLKKIAKNWRIVECEACGKPFNPANGNVLYCGDDCSRFANLKRLRDRYEHKPRLFRTRVCLMCGDEYQTKANPKYCPKCSVLNELYKGRDYQHRRRAKMNGVGYERFGPLEIFNRDDWRCQHCKKKTKPLVDPNHSLYPHLDHIIPLSRGGEHSRKNTQCLCRACNIVKGDKAEGEQMRLFG